MSFEQSANELYVSQNVRQQKGSVLATEITGFWYPAEFPFVNDKKNKIFRAAF